MKKIFAAVPGKYVGDYDGEVYNTWFEWDGALEIWLWTGPVG